MANIRQYIVSHLLAPLKQYPTFIQDTMIRIISDKLERLYNYTVAFPEIVTPNKNRLDILQAIADQFLFTVREEADLQEQVEILDKILYIYNKRGSVDTIENMWKYYGGELPRDVKVVVPSYNIFRYNISALSGTHAFLKGRDCYIELDTPAIVDITATTGIGDNCMVHIIGESRKILITSHVSRGSTRINIANSTGLHIGDRVSVCGMYEGTIVDMSSSNKEVLYDSVNTPGIYEIQLYNNTYPIPDLKEFLIKELVAAGNEIYFTNALYMQSIQDDISSKEPYQYKVYPENFIQVQLEAMKSPVGLILSGPSPHTLSLYDSNNPPSIIPSENSSYWSGSGSLFVELTYILDLSALNVDEEGNITSKAYTMSGDGLGLGYSKTLYLGENATYTDTIDDLYVIQILQKLDLFSKYEINTTTVESDFSGSNYPGYFILGATSLDMVYMN